MIHGYDFFFYSKEENRKHIHYDFFFYSKEENRKHIHVEKGDHEAKVWLEPMIEVAYNYGFSSREIKFILQIIERYEREIHERWSKHFGDTE